jgi:hypothetical protein
MSLLLCFGWVVSGVFDGGRERGREWYCWRLRSRGPSPRLGAGSEDQRRFCGGVRPKKVRC